MAFPVNGYSGAIAPKEGNAPSSADRFHQLTETLAHVLQGGSRDTSKKNRAFGPE
jgi:hypothetical protein